MRQFDFFFQMGSRKLPQFYKNTIQFILMKKKNIKDSLSL